MTLPASGPITLTQIRDEFGGANNSTGNSLGSYYRGGALVPNISTNSNIPTSGAISFYQFYGASKIFVFNQSITTVMTNYNLNTVMLAAGWDGTTLVTATITVNPGGTAGVGQMSIYSTDPTIPAFKIDTLPSGSTVTVNNYGNIWNTGGAATYENPSRSGGCAFETRADTTINNYGFILGGGGAGGCGADMPSYYCLNAVAAVGGAGGPAIRRYAALNLQNYWYTLGGGGGGGGGGQVITYGSSCGVQISGSGGGGGGGLGWGSSGGGPAGCLRYCSLNSYGPAGAGAASSSAAAGATTGGPTTRNQRNQPSVNLYHLRGKGSNLGTSAL